MVVTNPVAEVLVAGVLRPVVEATSRRQLRSRTPDRVAEGGRTPDKVVEENRILAVVRQILVVVDRIPAEAGRIRVVAMLEGHNRRVRSRVVRSPGMAEADRRMAVRRIGDVRRRTVRPGDSGQITGATCTSTISGFWRM